MTHEFLFTDVPYQRRRERRVRRLVAIAALLMAAGCVMWLAISARLGLWPIFWVDAGGLVAAATVLFLLRRRIDFARQLCLIALLGLLLGIMSLEGNAPRHGPVLHLYLLCLAAASYLLLFDWPTRVAARWTAACFAIYALRQLGWLRFPTVLDGDPTAHAIARPVTLIAVFLILVAITSLFVRDIAEAERQLGLANERLETVLGHMLPAPVAKTLLEKGRTFADAIPSCTILFAGVVGFTRLVAERSPGEIVGLLGQMFSRFDDLVERHGAEKIKTMGDTYMAVAGLPEQRPGHALVMARLALAMRAATRDLDIDVRIGINTGPVVAGVIGRRRFAYDVWGDTVNVAARMQTHGLPGQIQVSESTCREIAGALPLRRRGTIEVKGKGSMEVWLIDDGHTAAGPAGAPAPQREETG